MKMILTLSIIFLFIQISFGQACGVYELKYNGSIKSNSGKEFKIKLPSTFFFHTKNRKEKSISSFYEYRLNGSKIESIVQSHLTSIYTSNQLIKLYKSNRDFIPLIITTIDEKGIEKRQSKKVPIKNLKFRGIDRSNDLTQIIIDFGVIKI